MMNDYLAVNFSESKINNESPLGLAHIGDAVYELMVRSYLCENGWSSAHNLHRETVKYVNANFQATAIDKIFNHLTDDEIAVFKRGRNAKVNSVPRGSSVGVYHKASGFEAVFGYLYLKNYHDRLNELFNMIFDND